MRSDTAVQKAAHLLSCLASAEADQLLQRLPAAQAELVRRCLASHAPAPAARLAAAQRFIYELKRREPSATTHRIDAAERPFALHFLTRWSAAQLAAALTAERPSATACALSLLPAPKAADVLKLLPEDYQSAVVHHMLTARPVAADVQRELADSLMEAVSEQDAADCAARLGRDQLLAVLRCTDAETRQRLIDVVQQEGLQLDDAAALTGGPA